MRNPRSRHSSQYIPPGAYTIRCERKKHIIRVLEGGRGIVFEGHGNCTNPVALLSQGELLHGGKELTGCYAAAEQLLRVRSSHDFVRHQRGRRRGEHARLVRVGLCDEFIEGVLVAVATRRMYRERTKPYKLEEDYYSEPFFLLRRTGYWWNDYEVSRRVRHLLDEAKRKFDKKYTAAVKRYAPNRALLEKAAEEEKKT